MPKRTITDSERMCWFMPHAMEPYTPGPGEYDGPGWGNTYHLRCVRCPTIRHVTLDSLGNVSTSYYEPTKERREYLAARAEAIVNGRGDPRLQHLKAERARLRAERKARANGGRRSA